MGQFQEKKLSIPHGDSSPVTHDSATSLLSSGPHDPITLIPPAESSYTPAITPALLSMNSTGGKSKQLLEYAPPIIYTPELQQELTNRISGPEEVCPCTEPIEALNYCEYTNYSVFRAINLVMNVYLEYLDLYKKAPKELYISTKYAKEIQKDMEIEPLLGLMLSKIIAFEENIPEKKVFYK